MSNYPDGVTGSDYDDYCGVVPDEEEQEDWYHDDEWKEKKKNE